MTAGGFYILLTINEMLGTALAKDDKNLVLTRGARNDISCNRLAIHGDFADSLAYAVRVLDSDFVNRATEAASYRLFLP